MEKQTIIIGTIVPKEVQEKAEEKCSEQNTTLEQFIRSCIWSLANGDLTISRADRKEQ